MPQTGLFFITRAGAGADVAPEARRTVWTAPGAGKPVNWSLQVWGRTDPCFRRAGCVCSLPYCRGSCQ